MTIVNLNYIVIAKYLVINNFDFMLYFRTISLKLL